MSESRAVRIAAQNVHIWGIAECDHRRMPASAQLACNEKLTGISAE
jgi:hypothetical protein